MLISPLLEFSRRLLAHAVLISLRLPIFPLCRAKVQQAFVYNEGRELDWQFAADACRFNILFANLVICALANAKIQEGTARFFAINTELWRGKKRTTQRCSWLSKYVKEEVAAINTPLSGFP